MREISDVDIETVAGYKFLDIERKYLSDFEKESYEKFSFLLNKIKRDVINLKGKLDGLESEREFVDFILRYSMHVVFNEGYKYLDSNTSFNKRLTGKFFNCRDFAVFYLSVLHYLGFNLREVSLSLCPKHVFLKFNLNGEKFNWEPTGNIKTPRKKLYLSDEWYISHFIVFDTSIKRGVYMGMLTEEEILGLFHTGIGVYVLEVQNKIDSAIRLFERSIAINSNLSESYFYLGYSKYKKGVLDSNTKALLETAIRLNPGSRRAKELLTSVNIKLKYNS